MKKFVLLGGSFLIPLFLIAMIFSSLSIVPFGDNNLLISDIGTQYLQFMYTFRSFFITEPNFYSFSNGLGDSIEALWSYYLMSPLNFISFLFKKENLPVALLWIIMIKIAFTGLSMCYYFYHHYKKDCFSILIFSTAYSFCGFVTAYSFNYMWLDALILLPLVILGLERVWEGKRGILFCSSLFLTIITNYYLGYMVCLFSLLYSFYLYGLKNNNAAGRRFKKYLFYLIFTGLTTSFVLLPSFLGMLKTAKTNFSFTSMFSFSPNFLFSIFSRLEAGSIHYSQRLENLPVIYSGVLVALFVVVYFSTKKIVKREKTGAFLLLLATVLMMMIEPFNVLWHMFQSPAGFPYRNSFIVTFLLISFAYRGFLEWQNGGESKLDRKNIFCAASILAILFLIGAVSLLLEENISVARFLSGKRIVYLGITLLFLCFYSFFFYIWRCKKNSFLLLFVSLFFLAEIGLNLYIGLKDVYYGSQSSFSRFYKKVDHFIQKHNDKSQLVRIKENISGNKLGYDVPYYNYNDSHMFGFSGVSAYTSTLNKDVLETMKKLGAYSKNERRFSLLESNPILNLLLNVKYEIYTKKIEKRAPQIEDTNLYAYQNNEAIGAGIFVQDGEVNMQEEKVFKNLEGVLQGVSLSQKPYLRESTLLSIKNNSEITLRSNSDGELLMFLPNMDWTGVNGLTVNGKVHKPDLEIEANQMLNLGYFPKGATVKINIRGLKKEISPKSTDFYSLDQKQFHALVSEKRKSAVEIKKSDESHLTGKIKPSAQRRTLFLSIPYDSSWKVKVDGQNVETKKAFGHFMAVYVPAHASEISLTYHSPTLIYGILLSFLSFISGVLISRRMKVTEKNDARNRK